MAWELGAAAAESATRCGEAEFEKEVWLSGVMLTWGSAGQIVTVDDEPVGFVLYAPPTTVPGASAFPTAPVSPDAVLLTTARIRKAYRGQGLGRFLIEGAVQELTRRGVRAIELFGRQKEHSSPPVEHDSGDPRPGNDVDGRPTTPPSDSGGAIGMATATGRGPGSVDPMAGFGWDRLTTNWFAPDSPLAATGPFGSALFGSVWAGTGQTASAPDDTAPGGAAAEHSETADSGEPDPWAGLVPSCVLPAGFARAVGFRDVAPHPWYPRLRYELERDLGWKAEVEAALEKLFAVTTVPVSPAPFAADLVGQR